MLKLNHFSFSYIENHIILDDLNFQIQKGEKQDSLAVMEQGNLHFLKLLLE